WSKACGSCVSSAGQARAHAMGAGSFGAGRKVLLEVGECVGFGLGGEEESGELGVDWGGDCMFGNSVELFVFAAEHVRMADAGMGRNGDWWESSKRGAQWEALEGRDGREKGVVRGWVCVAYRCVERCACARASALALKGEEESGELGVGGCGDWMVGNSVGVFGVGCVCGLEVCGKWDRWLEDVCSVAVSCLRDRFAVDIVFAAEHVGMADAGMGWDGD
ncbi:hypothetical protein EAH_00067170, partial [Eimeria acervulina]